MRQGAAGAIPLPPRLPGTRWPRTPRRCSATASRSPYQLLVLTTGAERIVLGGGLSVLGNALENGIRSELTRDAAASDLVASLELADRFELLPSDLPVADLGAALLPARDQL